MSGTKRLLLVEDDARLASAMRSWMGLEGMQVEWIATGAEIEPALRKGQFDCLLLDLGLPDMSGEDALKSLRAADFDLPVIVVTAREQVQDRVRLLDLGADDFLVKPVHLDELSARLRAVHRRRGTTDPTETVLRHGPLRLMPASRTVSCDGRYLQLTNREFWLLEALMRQKGEVLSRAELVEATLAAGAGSAEESGGNAVEVHIHHLRRKLGPAIIKTVRGHGYALYAER
jgi:DNA-binding response OmpR family regulator